MRKTVVTRLKEQCITGIEAQSSFPGAGHLPYDLSQFYDTPNSRFPVPCN